MKRTVDQAALLVTAGKQLPWDQVDDGQIPDVPEVRNVGAGSTAATNARFTGNTCCPKGFEFFLITECALSPEVRAASAITEQQETELELLTTARAELAWNETESARILLVIGMETSSWERYHIDSIKATYAKIPSQHSYAALHRDRVPAAKAPGATNPESKGLCTPAKTLSAHSFCCHIS
jgi:hypothetical protein